MELLDFLGQQAVSMQDMAPLSQTWNIYSPYTENTSPSSWSWIITIGPEGEASAKVATRSILTHAAQHVTAGTLYQQGTWKNSNAI